MTHAELVVLAARWLERKHAIVITEMASGAMEEPDAIGFSRGFSTLIECKASRADFLRDRLKPCARRGTRMGDKRYLLTMPYIVDVVDTPEGWGLLWPSARGKGLEVRREATHVEEKDYRGEQALLISALRRIGRDAPAGVSVSFYTYSTKNRAGLGMAKEEA